MYYYCMLKEVGGGMTTAAWICGAGAKVGASIELKHLSTWFVVSEVSRHSVKDEDLPKNACLIIDNFKSSQ